ncbi:MAG: LysM peptidoglycan-binding domain-containing protein [Pirellulales bacterium]|nr:LysM peptidoglycan-binding domain-containing protein [Pirellulales bacterium]
MAREMKLGIAVIGVLLVVFCALLAKRLTSPSKLPLRRSSTAAENSSSTPTKPVAQAIRPTVVTPQADPTPPQSLWSKRNDSDSTVTSTPDRYTAALPPTNDPNASKPDTSAQPGLLAAPTPIPDLQQGATAESDSRLLYRSGYAGDSEAQPSQSNSIAATTQPADPFQRQSTATMSPQTPADPPPVGRYLVRSPDDTAVRSVAASDPLSDHRSAGPPSPPSAGDRDTSPTPEMSAQPYSPKSYGVHPSSQSSPSSVSPLSYGGSHSNNVASLSNRSNPPPATVGVTTALAGSPPTLERDGETYRVQPNDTFWTISEKAYGTGAFFKALYEHNRKRHRQADDLVIGQELSVPDENVLRRHFPDLCPRPRKDVASTEQRLMMASTKIRGNGRVYQVVEGDTLYDIAKFELGKSARWAEIYELNRDVLGDDFDYLRPGTELILPIEKPQHDSMTRQPTQSAPSGSGRY